MQLWISNIGMKGLKTKDLLSCYFQSALTGESLPVTKTPGDEVYSGSTCKQGEINAVVIATGMHTFLGRAAHLVDSTIETSHFQQVVALTISFSNLAFIVSKS